MARFETGIASIDALLGGGLIRDSLTVIAGPPGSGKTIFAQQICFNRADAKHRALYFSTLSEPSAKVLKYLAPFSYFDAQKLDSAIQFIDLGYALAEHGIHEAARQIMEHIKKSKPTLIVIDSFKVFDEFASSKEELRKFTYALAANLMAWEVTVLLIGEYETSEIRSNPLFSIIDGQILMYQRTQFEEELRKLRIVKMRGLEHSRDEHTFSITREGIQLHAPRVTIRREAIGGVLERMKTGILKLDDLIGEGIPRGASILVSGVAGTGKTILLLDFIIRGAERGEKGIIFSFEETDEGLRRAATTFGWDLDGAIAKGLIEIVFIPLTDIQVEAGLLLIEARINALNATRVAIDSLSVFLYKVRDPQYVREKVFQLASIIQNARAVGFFAADIAYASGDISHFGVEETVVDGIILLTSTTEGLERQRYVEIYKLRRTAHLKGRHSIEIGENGVKVFPRYSEDVAPSKPPIELGRHRLASGVPGLDPLLGGGLLKRSISLVSGSMGGGKTALGLQFIAAGAAVGEPGLFVSLEDGPVQVAKSAKAFGLPWDQALEAGLIHSVYLSPENVRTSQFFSLLGDKILAQKTRRLVLDGAAYLASSTMPRDELREMLLVLVSRFKSLDVTALLLFDAETLYGAEAIPERSFASVADNLLLLRYELEAGELKPFVQIVKTHDSAHDRRAYAYTLDNHGMCMGERIDVSRWAPWQAQET